MQKAKKTISDIADENPIVSSDTSVNKAWDFLSFYLYQGGRDIIDEAVKILKLLGEPDPGNGLINNYSVNAISIEVEYLLEGKKLTVYFLGDEVSCPVEPIADHLEKVIELYYQQEEATAF